MKAKISLGRFSPEEREFIARWIESKYEKNPIRVAQAEAYLKAHPDDPSLPGQINYWKTAISVAKQLAWFARTTRSRRHGAGTEESAK